jgi:hypothetical protein
MEISWLPLEEKSLLKKEWTKQKNLFQEKQQVLEEVKYKKAIKLFF